MLKEALMKFRIILLLCLLIFTVRINHARATTCPDSDVAAQIDSMIALTDLQTDPTARIAEIRGALLTLKQYCYPSDAPVVEPAPTETPPPPPVTAVVVRTYNPTNGFAAADLSGEPEVINQCRALTILSRQDNLSQVEYLTNFLDKDSSFTGWVYTELFPHAFNGIQLPGSQVAPETRFFADTGADAAEISAQWQADTLFTFSDPFLDDVSISTHYPAGLLSRLRVQLSNGGTGWLSPSFVASALLNHTIETSRDPTTAIRSAPDLSKPELVIDRVPPGTLLGVFEISKDGKWLHVNKRRQMWVSSSDIAPRVFIKDQGIHFTAALNFRKEPKDGAPQVIEALIPASGQRYVVKAVSDDGAWVQINYQNQDGWVSTCGIA
jgi:hypothetical protein